MKSVDYDVEEISEKLEGLEGISSESSELLQVLGRENGAATQDGRNTLLDVSGTCNTGCGSLLSTSIIS